MGPNGSGKSTLCHVLTGKEDYIVEGSAMVDGTELLGLPVDARARAGLFQAFQYPVEIPGVKLNELIVEMEGVNHGGAASAEFATIVEQAGSRLGIDRFSCRRPAPNSRCSTRSTRALISMPSARSQS
jgi:Fe-S cluster assembly ATP-binding protein